MKVAVVGAGWAGCAAAVEAAQAGHDITLYEAARIAGGRARRVDVQMDGQTVALDNGQHILIGAYTETLALMDRLGLDRAACFTRLPLTLRFPDGSGLRLPNLPAPLDAVAGILMARGWSLHDKQSLIRAALDWRQAGFTCKPSQSVASLCAGITPRVMQNMIEPLCVSALNTPAARASGTVFLRVLNDALFGASRGSNLLLPRVDLTALLPDAALQWLAKRGATVKPGKRVQRILQRESPIGSAAWSLDAGNGPEIHDHVILACPVQEAVRLIADSDVTAEAWLRDAAAIRHEALATVYALAAGKRGLKSGEPMLALPSSTEHPAQFVFDRGQLGGPAGLLAFVVSASSGEGAGLGRQVVAQAKSQLGLQVEVVRTVVEKRATFSCTPGLVRPTAQVAAGLTACGDYIAGPYPATLEGAVRSGLQAAQALTPN
jgi:hydroxysqualene dehydroxylase